VSTNQNVFVDASMQPTAQEAEDELPENKI